MTKRLLDRDPLTGIEVWHDYDEMTDETTISHTQDVESILEQNKILQNMPDRGYTSKAREFRRAAEIPLTLIYKWLIEEGIDVFNDDHWPAVKRKLNSNEYMWLRSGPGQI